MLRAVADTHAVIWYIFDDKRLSDTARSTIEAAAEAGDQVAFSSMTLAEIIYLIERGRVHSSTLERLTKAIDRDNAVLVDVAFDRSVAKKMQTIDPLIVPELPDRVIVATAVHLNLPLISRDHQIAASGITTIW